MAKLSHCTRNTRNSIYLQYDFKAINSSIPITSVLERYAGIDTSNYRSRNIRCPSTEHQDKKPSCRVYEKTNTCYCFSCNQSFNVLSLVTEHTGQRLTDACRQLINDYGLPLESYSNLNDLKSVMNLDGTIKDEEVFPLSPNDDKLLGLRAFNRVVTNPNYDVETYNEETDEFNHYTVGEPYWKIDSLADIWKDNKSLVEDIILGKCEEQKDRLNETKEDYIYQKIKIVNLFSDELTPSDFNQGIKLYEAYKKYSLEDVQINLNEKQSNLIHQFCLLNNCIEKIKEIDNLISKINAIEKKVYNMREKRMEKLNPKERVLYEHEH